MIQWYWLIIMAAVLGAFHNLMRKKALKKEHATEYLTIFAILVFALLLPFVGFVNFDQPGFVWMLLYVDSLLLTLSFVLISKAYRHLEVSEVAPLTNMNVIFILIVALLFLNESVTWFQLVGIFLVIMGAYVLEADPHFKDIWRPLKVLKSKHMRYIWLALGISAVTNTLGKILLTPSQVGLTYPALDPFTLTFLTRMFIAINFVIILVVYFDGFKGIKHGVKSAGLWILFAAAFFATGAVLYYAAVSMAFLTLAIAFSKIETLITTIAGGEMFHDHGMMQKVLASLIIVAGAILVIL